MHCLKPPLLSSSSRIVLVAGMGKVHIASGSKRVSAGRMLSGWTIAPKVWTGDHPLPAVSCKQPVSLQRIGNP